MIRLHILSKFRELINNSSSYGIKKDEASVYTYSSGCPDNNTINLQPYFKEEVLEDIKFDGTICALAKGAASLMINLINHKSIKDILFIQKNFVDMIANENHAAQCKELAHFKSMYFNDLSLEEKDCLKFPWIALGSMLQQILLNNSLI